MKIFEQQKKISKSIEENKIDENKLENYYIINAKWFYKMIKIFESDEIYDDDNYKIESFDNITNIINLNENDLKIKNDLFLKRKQILMDENLFKVEYEEKSGIKYLDKFVLIKENTLNDLLKELQITFKNIHINIYQTFNGEHFLFIKDNSYKNKYFVSSQKCMEFNTEIVFIFIEDNYFKKEINKHIKNKNGFEYYFKERNLDINNSQLQKIIDKEQELLGNVIIINKINNNNNINNSINNNINSNINNNIDSNINSKINSNINSKINSNINSNINKPNNENSNQEIIEDCCPYIKSLFLSLMKITKLKDFFINNQNLSQKNKISFLFSNFIRNFENDKKQLPNIINNAKDEIKKLNEEIITNLNFKDLIDFILINLHKELNTKKNINDDFSFEDYSKEACYKQFKKNFDSQNDSIISKLFFNEVETISICNKCKMPKYTNDICKYLFFDIKNQNKVTLNYLLKEFEERETNSINFCRMCVEDDVDISEKKKLKLYSEILIIILNNENNAEIEFSPNENFNDNNYNLISCINKSTNENTFKAIFSSNQKWYQFQNDFNEKEVGNNSGILGWNPQVLVYEKIFDYNSVNSMLLINNNHDNTLKTIAQTTAKREQNKEMEKMKKIMEQGKPMGNQMNNNQMNNQMNNIQLNNQMNNNQMNNQMNNMQMNYQMNNNQMNNQMNNMQMNYQMNNNQMNNMQMNNNQMNNRMNNMQMNNNQMNNQMNNMQMNNNQMNNQMNNMQLNNQMNNQMNNMQMNYQMNNNQMNNQMNINFNQNNCLNNNINQIYMKNNNNNMRSNNRYNPLINVTNEILRNNNVNNSSQNNFNNMNNNNNINNMNRNFINNNNMMSNNFNNQYNMNMNNNNINNMNNNNINNMNRNFINNNNMMPNNFNNQNNMNNNMNNNNINNMNRNFINNNNMMPNNFNNQNNMNNNINIPNNNNNQMNNNNNCYDRMLEDKNDIITIYFELSNNKQIYLDVKRTSYFRDVIRVLRQKYSWLNDLQIRDYKYNGKSVDYNKTLEQNLIKDSSLIRIIDN